MSITPVLMILAAMMAVMTLAFAIQRATGNSGWIDVTWTFGTGAVAAAGVLHYAPATPRSVILAGVLVLWALRLGLHIAARSRRTSDDPRYAALMQEWGQSAAFRLFLFLQVQALAGAVLAVSALAAALTPSPAFTVFDALGILVAFGALIGEATADRQLALCVASKTAICERGLWRWSRHPNYFFEFLFWCALPLIALSGAGLWPGVLSLLAPLQMYVLLDHVSGVPPLEAHMARTRGAAFAEYQRRVSRFFPWPPRPPSTP